MFTLYEELFILSIHEEKGTILRTAERMLAYGLSGAIIAELALQGKLRVEENHRLEVIDSSDTGDKILDNALGKIIESDPHKVNYWVRAFLKKPGKFIDQVGAGLVSKGVLMTEDSHWHWVLPYSQVEPNASVKYLLKRRLRELVLTCGDPDLHEMALLSLAKSSNLLFLIFTRDERKTAERLIHETLIGKALAYPAAQAIEEIESAVTSQTEAD